MRQLTRQRRLARTERGFTYVLVMFAVAVASVVSLRAMEHTGSMERRQKEQELLHVGQAYYDAIRTYYENSPGSLKTLPVSLDVLLEDDRTSTLRRPLRKLYRDPMTGSADWGLVLSDDGKIAGVYSLAPGQPFKTGGFRRELAHFANARSFAQWQFTYVPVHTGGSR